MSHLDDLQAMQELMRMSWNPDSGIRDDAIKGMGASGHSRFIELLILRGEDEQHTEVRRSILHSLEQLTFPGKRPPGLLDEFAYDAKISLWRDDWERQHLRVLPSTVFSSNPQPYRLFDRDEKFPKMEN